MSSAGLLLFCSRYILFIMLAIKLQRVGKKHQPSYRLVVAEKRSKMAAPPVEDLGAYDPFTKAAALNGERVSYWMKNGAQPTLTVHNLLVANGVLAAPKRAAKMKIKKKVETAAGGAKPATPEDKAEAPAAAETAPGVEAKIEETTAAPAAETVSAELDK